MAAKRGQFLEAVLIGIMESPPFFVPPVVFQQFDWLQNVVAVSNSKCSSTERRRFVLLTVSYTINFQRQN